MAEVQEQRNVCKICSKICVSGKSLGGHMRVHLAQISASKKAAQEVDELKLESDDHEHQNGSSNLKEKIEHYGSNKGLDDGEQSSSYELRENPKKSWRVSDPKDGLINNTNSCKECGKEFASSRALSGHMRCHSIKNKKELHHCKECGRGFDSMRAMFGHMKSHSKRVVKASGNVESAGSLSICPVRRKRSRIRYNDTISTSIPDDTNCDVSELEEAEEAAKCLLMLSKGVHDLVAESSDDDSAYFGAFKSCRNKRLCGVGGGFVSDGEKELSGKLQMELCSSGYYANAGSGKNACGFDEVGLKLVVKDQAKIDLEVVDEILGVENGIKVDFLCDDRKPIVDALLAYEQPNELAVTLESADGSESTKSAELDQFLVANSSQNEGMLEYFEKKGRTNYNLGMNANLLSVTQADSKLDQESGSVGSLSLVSRKSKEHECPICFKVFPSGQALGGHKRAHYNGVAESKNREAMAPEAREMLDLNFPIAGLGLTSWFIDRSLQHKAFVLTT